MLGSFHHYVACGGVGEGQENFLVDAKPGVYAPKKMIRNEGAKSTRAMTSLLCVHY